MVHLNNKNKAFPQTLSPRKRETRESMPWESLKTEMGRERQREIELERTLGERASICR
jgi:hypothetical protein